MAEIKIKSVSPGANEEAITFELTERPNNNWIAHFEKAWSQSSLKQQHISHNFGNATNKLSFNGAIGEPQTLVDEVKKLMDSVNQVENSFAKKIKNLKL
jgi:hypothetical protein